MKTSYKIIDWTKVLQPDLACTAEEIAQTLNMHILTVRHYLRRSVAAGQLEVRSKGKTKFYALPKSKRQRATES